MYDLKKLLAKFIAYPSVSPNDAGCQEFMIQYLEDIGFECTRYDNQPVSNFFAHRGHGSPFILFAGHTDVVPAGDLSKWDSDPFILQEREGYLYGRGTADMKGSLAAMLIAVSRYLIEHPNFSGSIGFLITSGEEGNDFNLGTPYVMQHLAKQEIHPDYCLVGEPSSTDQLGDVVKIGRRGSLTGILQLHGKQGHVAYPHLAENPIHKLGPALNELISTTWDQGNAYFPPTSLQMTHIQSGGIASNVIPGELTLQFNFRFSTEQTASRLKEAVAACFNRHGLTTDIEWRLNGDPFLTTGGKLIDVCIKAIESHTHQKPELSTSGGTSDGRFIAPYGVEVVELGPINATIHQVNERVSLADLEVLSNIYYSVCDRLLSH